MTLAPGTTSPLALKTVPDTSTRPDAVCAAAATAQARINPRQSEARIVILPTGLRLDQPDAPV
ncbi:MAG TPA: hypothetical protein VFD58_05285 [Blastocatellia bacterium]|nr:hypothetical protein [Blastocatellia bacterium]